MYIILLLILTYLVVRYLLMPIVKVTIILIVLIILYFNAYIINTNSTSTKIIIEPKQTEYSYGFLRTN